MSDTNLRISANVGGHAGWAYAKYRELTGKSPQVILTEMIEHWTETNQRATDLDLTLKDYLGQQGGELVEITSKAKKKVSS